MKKIIELTLCNQCEKEIKNNNYILLPKGDLDTAGVWFGDVRAWLWFDDEHFCSVVCFIEYVQAWHTYKIETIDNDE